jgi:hypothetical protein
MFVENFFFRHAGSEPAQDVPEGDAKSANARLSASLARLNRDSRVDL